MSQLSSRSERRARACGWPRSQLVAIVAEYWRKGERSDVVADKLAVTVAHVESIYAHVAWTEGGPQSDVPTTGGTDPGAMVPDRGAKR